MVSFRLSPDEYQRFDAFRVSRRIVSLSELAREAMEAMASRRLDQAVRFNEMQDLRKRIQALSHEIERFAVRVERRKLQAVDGKETSAGMS